MIKPDYQQYKTEKEKWHQAGSPVRTPEKILELFNICSQCPSHIELTSSIYQCGECSCILRSRGRHANKLAMATTKCPLPEPKWIEEEGYRVVETVIQQEPPEEKIEAPVEAPQEPRQFIRRPPKTGGCGC